MIIVCFGYRSWAINIYKKISKLKKIKVYIFKNKKKVDYKYLYKINPKFILFYGWSWTVPKDITDNFKCIMLHPSKLPGFRGGSPIQNQIIRGIKKSAISLFRMNKIIDGGNIIYQKSFSLGGDIKDIFCRLENIGYNLTKKLIIKKKYSDKKQKLKNTKIYRRRKPIESEITLKDLKNKSSNYLYNKIRMLGDPYPNAYIKTKDNKKLVLKKVILEKIK